MRFRKGGRYRRSEVEGLPTTLIILFVVVSGSRSYVTLSVSRSYVTRLFEVDTNFKNVFTLNSNLVYRTTWLHGTHQRCRQFKVVDNYFSWVTSLSFRLSTQNLVVPSFLDISLTGEDQRLEDSLIDNSWSLH